MEFLISQMIVEKSLASLNAAIAIGFAGWVIYIIFVEIVKR
jgi:hypothetical protein